MECPNCHYKISEFDQKCPKCKINFDEYESNLQKKDKTLFIIIILNIFIFLFIIGGIISAFLINFFWLIGGILSAVIMYSLSEIIKKLNIIENKLR